jgi:myo-inositol-1(or 4)-monophosphatase
VNELDVALEAARAAGAILAKYAELRPRHVTEKTGPTDLVTEVDLACEAAIREVLHSHLPDVPVLGEEQGGSRTASGPLWVIDPVDGTTNFVHGFPFYAVSVALQVDGQSVVGVVLDPVRRREYTARRGLGAFRDGHRLQVSSCPDLGHALVGTGFPADRRTNAARYLRYVEAVLSRSHGIRRGGAASLDLALLAEGCLDAFWEFHLSLWDVAAGILLIEEAGGRVTSLDGGPMDRVDVCVLATNTRLHEGMIALLASVPPIP